MSDSNKHPAPTGPRDYTVGTERALYAYSATTCYYPDCMVRVIEFVEGDPVSNVEIAHIRGANPNSPRFDPSMTDDDRRSFSNLILLCKPHHNIVDRLHPERFPVEVLREWKSQHERESGIDADALGRLTEDRLVELIEEAVGNSGPQRLLTVELGIGIAARAHGSLISLPADKAKDFFEQYRNLGPAVLVLTVRSTGNLKAYVNGHGLRFSPLGATLSSPNHYPDVNPSLPCAVDVGESQSWVYDLITIQKMVRLFRDQGHPVSELVGEATLGSAEKLESDALPISLLGPERSS